jgi:glycosyltransferase involved in cell wall biosynthesis
MRNDIELSIIMPCFNEEKTVGICVKKAKKAIKDLKIKGEVIVVDNNSTDNSIKNSLKAGAKVVRERKAGYGNALKRGFKEAKGRYVIMADSDDTYDFYESKKIYKKLKQGYDLVMGDRYRRGKIEKGATPFSHKIGAPILTFILNTFYHTKISDAHCGIRGISKDAYKSLNMQTEGMEFASEMIVKAGKRKLNIAEVPVTLSKRKGSEAKLSTFSDGWRHLSFLLTQGTNFTFIYPGILIFIIGVIIFILLSPGHFTIFGRTFYYHVLYIASILVILGYNILIFGILTKQYSSNEKFIKPDRITKIIKSINMNKILLFGLFLILLSIGILADAYIAWSRNHFGVLLSSGKVIAGVTIFILGAQTIFSGLFSKIIELKK